ncbi:MAG: hypothetical protein K6E54_02445 [Bacteroidaceae bacterium]|nr:hypothetical protein [Bacteroidaceae bacterium]
MIISRHKIINKVIDKVGLRSLPLSVAFLLLTVCLCSCEDATNTYSTRELVRCNYVVSSYTELFGSLGNYGQFASIREMGSGKVRMTLAATGKYTDYTPTKVQQYFYFGLGGLIVGTNYNGENLAYDLSCPYCDQTAYRLSLSDNGYAKCNRCGITYDLNNYGIITSVDSTKAYGSVRALYRYRISFDGTNLSVYN